MVKNLSHLKLSTATNWFYIGTIPFLNNISFVCSAVAVAATTAKGRSFAYAGGATDGSGLVTVAAQRPLLTPVSGTHARRHNTSTHTVRCSVLLQP